MTSTYSSSSSVMALMFSKQKWRKIRPPRNLSIMVTPSSALWRRRKHARRLWITLNCTEKCLLSVCSSSTTPIRKQTSTFRISVARRRRSKFTSFSPALAQSSNVNLSVIMMVQVVDTVLFSLRKKQTPKKRLKGQTEKNLTVKSLKFSLMRSVHKSRRLLKNQW